MNSVMATQMDVAKQTKAFLSRWGLKQKFVAKTCGIPETIFSEFLNGKAALSAKQLEHVVSYVDDYVRRNG